MAMAGFHQKTERDLVTFATKTVTVSDKSECAIHVCSENAGTGFVSLSPETSTYQISESAPTVFINQGTAAKWLAKNCKQVCRQNTFTAQECQIVRFNENGEMEVVIDMAEAVSPEAIISQIEALDREAELRYFQPLWTRYLVAYANNNEQEKERLDLRAQYIVLQVESQKALLRSKLLQLRAYGRRGR